MMNEYESDARHLNEQHELEMLKFDMVLMENEISDEVSSLTKLMKRISILSTKCTPGFRSEANKILFIRSVMIDNTWAERAVRRITTVNLYYNGLVIALSEQLQLDEEKKCSGTYVE